MYSIAFLTIYVLCYPRIRTNPDGGAARFLRQGLPIILLSIGAYFLYEKFKFGYVPTLEQLNPFTILSLIQGYASLWFVHVLTSTTWILSRQNIAPWITMPWQIKSGKLMGLVRNALLCVGLVPILAVHMVVVALIVWGYLKAGRKRAQNARLKA